MANLTNTNILHKYIVKVGIPFPKKKLVPSLKNVTCATRIHNKVSETFSDRKIYLNTSFRLPVCSLRQVKRY